MNLRWSILFFLLLFPWQGTGATDIQSSRYIFKHNPTNLDRQIKFGFLRFLNARQGNPAAKEIFDFLDSHPEIGYKSKADLDVAARWDGEEGFILLDAEYLESFGIQADSPKLSPERLEEFLTIVSPTLVHETVHAQVQVDLPFGLLGIFEDELLAYAYEGWFMQSEPGLFSERLYEAGGTMLDQYYPFVSQIKDLVSKLEKNKAGLKKLEKNPDSKRKTFLLEEKNTVERKFNEVNAKIQSITDRLKKEFNWRQVEMAGAWAAFSRGRPDLEKMVRFHNPDKDSLYLSGDEIKKLVSKLKADSKKFKRMLDSLPNNHPHREDFEDAIRVIGVELEFWTDPQKVEKARAYFEKRFEALKAHSGKGFLKP